MNKSPSEQPNTPPITWLKIFYDYETQANRGFVAFNTFCLMLGYEKELTPFIARIEKQIRSRGIDIKKPAKPDGDEADRQALRAGQWVKVMNCLATGNQFRRPDPNTKGLAVLDSYHFDQQGDYTLADPAVEPGDYYRFDDLKRYFREFGLNLSPFPSWQVDVSEFEGQATPGNRFALEGEFYSVTFDGRRFTIKKTVGMQYIVTLLSAPGKDFSACDLFQDAGRAPLPRQSATGGDTMDAGLRLDCMVQDPIVDGEAIRNIKKRISELVQEIEEAEANSNMERALLLRAKKESIEEQVYKATRPGGGAKAFRNDQARMIASVSKAISRGIDRIGSHDPDLAEHLRQSIKPVSPPYAYRPGKEISWVVTR